jgi:hypothetical protein
MTDKQKTGNRLGSVLLGAALFFIFLGERVFGADTGRTLGSGLGIALLLGAVALRIQTFRRAQGDARAVEARLLAAYGGVIVGLGLYALSTESVVNALKLDGDARNHFVAVLTSLWSSVILVSIAALAFMELVYARMPVAASVELRRVRTAAYAGLTLALSVVFLLSINYVASERDWHRDLSYFKTTQPSPSTLKLVDKLDMPLRAVLFWRRADDVLPQVEPYFSSLAAHTKNFHYEVLDSAFVPELCRKHKVKSNGVVLLITGEGENEKGQQISIGDELTEARDRLRKLDGLFQQNFTKLTRPERAVSLTVGHGEHNTSRGDEASGDSVRAMEEIWKRLNVKTNRLGLTGGLGSAVPAISSAVVVVGPKEKFLPEEVETLLGYVRKGGRLLLMIDPDVDDGLDPLLEGLGVRRMPGTVNSEKNHLRRNHDKTDKALVFSNKYSSHPTVTTASQYQNEVASIFVKGVALERHVGDDLKPKPTVSLPLPTGGGFYRDLDGDFERDANEPEEPLNMIAAISVSEGEGKPQGRVVVIGDGDFMTDKVSTNNGNVMVFVDALAWLIGNEDLNASVSSEEDVPIEHSRQQDKLWFYATTFAVPLPLLIVAGWVARRRRRPSETSA